MTQLQRQGWTEMHAFARLLFCLTALSLSGCVSPTLNKAAPPYSNSSPTVLDWHQLLDPWQGALTSAEWTAALDERFVPKGAAKDFVAVSPDALQVQMRQFDSSQVYILRNRPTDTLQRTSSRDNRYWRTLGELGSAPPNLPLAGLRIALDPGHLGGTFGVMEGRSFSVDGRPPVQEGDLALRVAQLLKPRLEALGVQVSLVRDHPGPVTTDTPESLRPAATAQWIATANTKSTPPPPPGDPQRELQITQIAERMFYVNSEIRARAQKVNYELQPDLVLCLHLDAVDWADPKNPTLVNQQHFHIVIDGSYLPSEIASDEQRLEMLQRIASGADIEELAVARAMATGAAPVFGLPPAGYSAPTGVALGGNGYVWGRNLLATRLYRCPVVFLEPYVANSVEGYERIQAGEYAGTRAFNGVERKNIFVEYGDAVVAGLLKYYGNRPTPTPAAKFDLTKGGSNLRHFR